MTPERTLDGLTIAEIGETTASILMDVCLERNRQVCKWGDQRHADGTAPMGDPRYVDLAGIKRRATEAQARTREDGATWLAITEEELYEALGAGTLEELDGELVQLAAVVVAWLVDVRWRRRAEAEREPTPAE